MSTELVLDIQSPSLVVGALGETEYFVSVACFQVLEASVFVGTYIARLYIYMNSVLCLCMSVSMIELPKAGYPDLIHIHTSTVLSMLPPSSCPSTLASSLLARQRL